MEYNNIDLWQDLIPLKTKDSHKYNHGHLLIYGAPELTGATRLAASAAARMGAGLVSVLADENTVDIYRSSLPAHILVRNELSWNDDRVTAKIYGCGGLPVDPDFTAQIPIVLDAEALYNLPDKLSPNYILSPHEGEFERAFPDIRGNKIERTKKAAKQINVHIVLKGSKTIIAAPDGRVVVNDNACPYLASAGTGDVLSGMLAGLLAQSMPIFEACCAAVWAHGQCGKNIGVGLVASDIIDVIPSVLHQLLTNSS